MRHARQLRGLTQTELAKQSGTAQGTISDMENGRQRSSAALIEIAHALKVRPKWLADGSGPMDAKPGIDTRDELLQRFLDAWDILTPEQREAFAKLAGFVAD
jgi:transcriptional regulator with XRE-family HTH domain